ncbi:MAG: hypothetical protein ACRDG7_08055 [Candidatus Limnocylindria bacterium]
MPRVTSSSPRWFAFALTATIVELTLITAYIHLTLGGLLFTLNAAGYALLALSLAIGALPNHLIARVSWLPRIGLAAFTATTIGAYLVIGPHFSLGWVAKAVEVAILTLLAADVMRVYGSPAGLARAAIATFHRRPGRGPMRTA